MLLSAAESAAECCFRCTILSNLMTQLLCAMHVMMPLAATSAPTSLTAVASSTKTQQARPSRPPARGAAPAAIASQMHSWWLVVSPCSAPFAHLLLRFGLGRGTASFMQQTLSLWVKLNSTNKYSNTCKSRCFGQIMFKQLVSHDPLYPSPPRT